MNYLLNSIIRFRFTNLKLWYISITFYWKYNRANISCHWRFKKAKYSPKLFLVLNIRTAKIKLIVSLYESMEDTK